MNVVPPNAGIRSRLFSHIVSVCFEIAKEEKKPARRTVFSLLLFCCLLAGLEAYGQKLYLFTGGDVRDDEVGGYIEQSVSEVSFVINNNILQPYLVEYNNPDGSSDMWSGPDIAESQNVHDDILTAIDSCPAGPDDTIFFYWCGHGAYDDVDGQRKHYLIMPNSDGKQIMFRSDLLKALKKKRPRLLVLVTDSCNSFQKITLEAEPAYAPSPAAPTPETLIPTPGIPPLFVSLFFKCRGTVDINSSNWNQKAAVAEYAGCVFTATLLDTMNQHANTSTGWQGILNTVNSGLRKNRLNQTVARWSFPSPDISRIPSRDVSKMVRLSESGEYASNQDRRFGNDVGTLGPGGGYRDGGWSAPAYHPEAGDRIIEVNGIRIQDKAGFTDAVQESDTTIVLTLVDRRTGHLYDMKTELLPRNYPSRLGIDVRQDDGEGVVVANVMANMPGNRCRYFKDGSVRPVRDRSNVIGGRENRPFHSNILIDTETNEYTGPGSWSAPVYHPENGDRIIEVNGTIIRNTDDFREVIRNSESEAVIALIDRRSGDPYFMKTTLLPRGSRSRLGITVRDDEESGAVVTGVMANMPGYRCRYFKDGNVQPVRDR